MGKTPLEKTCKEISAPLISVVMAVYNGEDFLPAAIESVLQQTWKLFEFIIINDASTDGTPEILNKYQSTDDRIRIIKNEANLGLGASLRKGIEISKGEFIARMDADDVSLTHRFEKQVEYLLNHPEIFAVGGKTSFMDDNGGNLDSRLPMESDLLRWNMLLGNGLILIHGSVMFRREFFDRFGTYSDLRAAQDFELWTRTFSCQPLPLANLNEIIYLTRDHEKSTTNAKSDLQETNAINIRLESISNFLGRSVSPDVVVAYRHPGDNYLDIQECILTWIDLYEKFMDQFQANKGVEQYIKNELLYEINKYTTLRSTRTQIRFKASIWKIIPRIPLKFSLNILIIKINEFLWNQNSKYSST